MNEYKINNQLLKNPYGTLNSWDVHLVMYYNNFDGYTSVRRLVKYDGCDVIKDIVRVNDNFNLAQHAHELLDIEYTKACDIIKDFSELCYGGALTPAGGFKV